MRVRFTTIAGITLSVALVAVLVGRSANAADSSYEILVMNAAGGKQTNLTNAPAINAGPAWSPDGSRIAFVSNLGPHGACNDVFVMNADGGDLTQLTDDQPCDSGVAWSPDGTRIAFDHGDGTSDIYVISASGSDRTRLTTGVGSQSNSSPSWSPDGSKIAFTSDPGGAQFDIFVMDADGRNPVNLTPDPDGGIQPAWSPDGMKIAYIGGANEVYLMNADGGGRQNLTNHGVASERDYDPSWSPDGTQIAFTSEVFVGGGSWRRVMVMNADGSGRRVLTANPRGSEDPAWSPDGTRIAFSGDPSTEPPPPPPPPGPPQPPASCRVPSVVGKRLAVARKRVRRARCTVGRIRRAHARRVGFVLKQTPRAGRRVRAGARVNLVVGRR